MGESSELVSYLNGRLVPLSQAAGQVGIGLPEPGTGASTSERIFGGNIYTYASSLNHSTLASMPQTSTPV